MVGQPMSLFDVLMSQNLWKGRFYFTSHFPRFQSSQARHLVNISNMSLQILGKHMDIYYGATSIDKISEVRLSDEIGGGGVWNSEKNELYNHY